MKKLLALLLGIAMILALLAGCGSSTTTETSAAQPAAEETEAAPAEDTPAEAEQTGEAEQAGDEGVIACDPMTLNIGSGMGPNEVGSLMMEYLADQVEAISGGAITVNRYTGGTLYIVPEEFEAISSGIVDVGSFLPDFALSTCPYIYFPDRSDISHRDAIDTFNYIVNENEETSALIEEQMASANVKVMGCEPGGNITFVSTKPITSFEDARNTKFGEWSSADFYEALGFTIIATDQASLYDSLARGVYETTTMGFAPMMSAKLYEVAPNILLVNSYGVACYISVNLDKWNSMTPEQQAVLEAAVAATEEYSAQYYEDGDSTNLDILEDNGCTVTLCSDEENHLFSVTEIYARCNTCRDTAENLGCTEGMETILNALGERFGLDLSPEAVAENIG